MREYVRPMMTGETFAPNEYVAACWTVACKVGNGDYGNYAPYRWWGRDWSRWGGDEPYGSKCHDHTGSCSQAVNNQFNVAEDGTVSFYAESSSDQGSLNGGFTSYIDNNGNSKVDDGDIIFWYTLSASGDRRWNHYGVVTDPDSSHPNRS